MAVNPIPPLAWTCPQCGQSVPAGQSNCPNCAGAGAPPPPAPRPPHPRPAPPLPAPAPAAPRVVPRRAPANPPAQPAAPPPHHGTRQQYVHPLRANVGRDENWIAHGLFVFFVWMTVLGGLALLGWLFYGGFLWGWRANPCKPPCVTTPTSASIAPARAKKPAPAVRRTATRQPPVQPAAAPQQVQVSGSLDLVLHEAQTQTATPAQRPNLEDQEARFWKWTEGRNP